MYLNMSNTCFGNNTVFNDKDVHGNVGNGITCFRRGSMSTASILRSEKGEVVQCDTSVVRCKKESGSLTIYTHGDFRRDGMYNCCISGLCISTRIYRNSNYTTSFNSSELNEFHHLSFLTLLFFRHSNH